MSDHCHAHHPEHDEKAWAHPGYQRVLWVALAVNATMFGIEALAGVASGSVSLLADAIDFFGDAGNYALSLAVLSLGVALRARAAQFKALCMLTFGVGVAGHALWSWVHGTQPEPVTMGLVGLLALAANVGVAVMLYSWREGDANMRSVWLCSRNDALGNVAVMGAALAVGWTGQAWPDRLVALVMAALAIHAGLSVWRQARGELRHAH